MGIGEAAGSHRAMEAAKQAIRSPLLENVSIEGAKGMIVNIVGDRRLTLAEIQQAIDFIKQKVSPEANIKFGQAFDESLAGKIRITVIATGFPSKRPRLAVRESHFPSLSSVPGYGPQRPAGEASARGGDAEGGGTRDDWERPAFLHWKVKKLQWEEKE